MTFGRFFDKIKHAVPFKIGTLKNCTCSPETALIHFGVSDRMRVLQPEATNTNDARKLLRALRSVDMEEKAEADKKSDKSTYDFIRFGR